MVNKWKHRVLTLCLSCVLLLSAIADGADGFERLTLQIATEEPAPLPMEPIPITISVFNSTENPILGYPVIRPNAGFLKIFVASEAERFKQFKTADWPFVLVPSPKKRTPLEPGYRNEVSGFLYFASPAAPHRFDPNALMEQHLLPSPGIYRVKATLKDRYSNQTIESNVITIEVQEPTGENSLAYDFLKEQSYPYFLMSTFGRHWSKRDQAAIRKKEKFLSRFPNSGYARYVYYSLGRTYMTRGGDSLDAGIEMSEKAASYEDFFLADEALRVLAETASKRGELDKAREYRAMLKKARKPEAAQAGHWPIWAVLLAAVFGTGIVIAGLILLLKKKASSRGKSRAT